MDIEAGGANDPRRHGAPAAPGHPRLIDGRAEDRHRWALAALAFPLFFCAVVAFGAYLMIHRQMGYFKPAPSGDPAAGSAPPPAASADEPADAAAHRCRAPARCADPASGSPGPGP